MGKDDDPCGDQCINGKKFCLATNSCLRSSSSCDCPRDKWPAENCGPVEKCSLFANETLPRELVSRCSILVDKSCHSGGCGTKHTRIKGGDCHPSLYFAKKPSLAIPFCIQLADIRIG